MQRIYFDTYNSLNFEEFPKREKCKEKFFKNKFTYL